MNKEPHTDGMIVQYLLGSLPEDETERLDELAIVDDEFAVRLQLAENDLVDAYVSGELSGETLERFTSFYLSSPKRREKVRFAQVFQKAPDQEVVTARAAIGLPKQSRVRPADEPVSRPGWLRGLFSPPALVWGFAAIALLLVTAGVVVQNRRLHAEMVQAQSERAAIQERERDLQTELDSQRSASLEKEREMESLRDKIARLDQPRSSESPGGQSPENLMVVPVDLAPQTRGINRLSTVSIPAAADLVTVQLELESGDYQVYRAELKPLSGGPPVWASGRLRPRAKESGRVVVVNLRPHLLKSQRYVLEVSGISSSGGAEIVGSYPFEVKKK